MPSLPLNFAHSEKPRQIQANMIAYMRLWAGLPGIVMVDEPGLFWCVSQASGPGDAILRVRWPAAGVEERIDSLFQQIGHQIDHMDWMIFPGDEPTDLGQRLAARGMPGGPGGNWLWADLTALDTDPSVPDDFHIKPVLEDAMLREWVDVSQAGFGGDVSSFYDAYARHGYGPDAFSLHYIGYLGDTPVTSGTVLDFGGTASIYDISTPPDYRRQGFGGAITHALMHEIRNRGYDDTWIWSSNMAKSVYQQLGYIDADFGMREHQWRRPD